MIGGLSKKFSIQENNVTQDDAGGSSYNWIDIMEKPSVFGKIKNVGSNNRYILGQEKFHVSHKLKIRFRDDISVLNRLKRSSRIFEIQAVINIDEENRFLELLLLERV